MHRTLTALLFVALALPLAAQISFDDIDPMEGFTFGGTTVTITGTGFDLGAVSVIVGGVPATIVHVTPTTIRAVVQPGSNRAEGHADVTVRVAGVGEITRDHAFYFSPLAWPNRDDYGAVIVPLTATTFPGANGSVWTSELRVFNYSNIPLRMPGPPVTIVELPIDFAVIVPPLETGRVSLARRDSSVDGHFLYVPRPLAYAPKFSLRVRDLSQNAASAGTEIPVIHESQASGEILLVDVPNDPKYRGTLRIYGFTPAPMIVGVTIYPENGLTPIEKYDVELLGILTTEFVPFPPHPSYLAINPFTPAVRASGHERIRIEITNYGANVSPPLPSIWAFVSITNNETQQVTAVTPR
jgi:IPT/TIG domain